MGMFSSETFRKLVVANVIDTLKNMLSFLVMVLFVVVIAAFDFDYYAWNVVLVINAFSMFILALVRGFELPKYVRYGVARHIYFKSMVVSSLFDSVVFSVSLLVIQGAIGGQSILAMANNFQIFVVLILILMVSYAFGACAAFVWQRFGWKIGVVCSVILGTGLSNLNLTWMFDLFLITVLLSGVFTVIVFVGSYFFARDISIKVK